MCTCIEKCGLTFQPGLKDELGEIWIWKQHSASEKPVTNQGFNLLFLNSVLYLRLFWWETKSDLKNGIPPGYPRRRWEVPSPAKQAGVIKFINFIFIYIYKKFFLLLNLLKELAAPLKLTIKSNQLNNTSFILYTFGQPRNKI